MASWCMTDRPNVDWAAVNWDNLTQYKYRYTSSDSHPVAVEEFDRWRQAGLPAVMWRFDDNYSPPTKVDQRNV